MWPFKKKCKHDWYYIKTINGSQLIKECIANCKSNFKVEDYLYAMGIDRSNFWYTRKVCLNCEEIFDEITEFEDKLSKITPAELLKRTKDIKEREKRLLRRKEQAEEIFKRKIS